MKTYTQADFDTFEVDKFGRKICPTGDYTAIKDFVEYCVFGTYCLFGAQCRFIEHIQAATDALRSLLQGAGMNGAVVETALASFKKGCWEVSEAAAKAADAVQKMHSEMAAKASAATAKTGQSVYAKYSDISAPDIANYTVDTTKLVQSYQAVKQQITDIQTVQSSGAKVSQAQWQLLIDAAQQYEIALKNVKVEQKDATVTQKKADKELADLDKLQNKLTQLQATFGEGYGLISIYAVSNLRSRKHKKRLASGRAQTIN